MRSRCRPSNNTELTRCWSYCFPLLQLPPSLLFASISLPLHSRQFGINLYATTRGSLSYLYYPPYLVFIGLSGVEQSPLIGETYNISCTTRLHHAHQSMVQVGNQTNAIRLQHPIHQAHPSWTDWQTSRTLWIHRRKRRWKTFSNMT